VKAIRLLLATYVFFLSVYPCSDGNTCADEQKAGVMMEASAHPDHASSEQDLCSPFCICSCCASHIQLITLHDLSLKVTVNHADLSTLYVERPPFGNASSIWQPPKIS